MVSSIRIFYSLIFLAVVGLTSCHPEVDKILFIQNKSSNNVELIMSDPICEQFKVLRSLAKNGTVNLQPGFDTTFLLGPGGWDDRTERFDLRECIENSLQPLPGNEGNVGEMPTFFMNQYGYKDHEMKIIFE